jgi:hypothetical protein
MSSLGIVIWIATFALCAVYFYIAFKQKKEAELSFANYAIGGGKIPFFLLFFTHFAIYLRLNIQYNNSEGHFQRLTSHTCMLPLCFFQIQNS